MVTLSFFKKRNISFFIHERHTQREREREREREAETQAEGEAGSMQVSLMWDSIPGLQDHALDLRRC